MGPLAMTQLYEGVEKGRVVRDRRAHHGCGDADG
jgi:hypothetical protein